MRVEIMARVGEDRDSSGPAQRVERVWLDTDTKDVERTGQFFRLLEQDEDPGTHEAVSVINPADFEFYRYVKE